MLQPSSLVCRHFYEGRALCGKRFYQCCHCTEVEKQYISPIAYELPALTLHVPETVDLQAKRKICRCILLGN
jgi:hypothetical protein